MNLTTKRILFFSITILLVILIIINREKLFSGKIIIQSSPPYTVNVFSEPLIFCDSPNCQIKNRPGTYTLIIQKPDHQTQLIDVQVKLWRTTNLTVQLKPSIKAQEIQNIPIIEANNFQLITDNNTLSQTLIDQNSTPLAFFPRKLTDPQIIYNNNFILISDTKELYLIDTFRKNRKKLPIQNIQLQNAQLSLSGEYLAYQESERIKIINLHSFDIIQTPFHPLKSIFLWSANDKLYLTSTENYLENQDPNSSTKYTPEESPSLLFFMFNPFNQDLQKILEFSETNTLPNLFKIDLKGQNLYFTDQEKAYQITL